MGPRQLKRRFDELCQRCFHSRSISHGGREREPDAESIPLAVKDQPFEGDAWDCRESPLQYRIAEEVLKVPGRFRRGGPPFVRITLSKPSFPTQARSQRGGHFPRSLGEPEGHYREVVRLCL